MIKTNDNYFLIINYISMQSWLHHNYANAKALSPGLTCDKIKYLNQMINSIVTVESIEN